MSDPTYHDEIELTVEPREAGSIRLDQFLADALKGVHSRSRLQAFIRAGAVRVDGVAETEPKKALKGGETVTLSAPAAVEAEPAPQAIDLTILYEDDDLIVIDKPAGLVVHPGAGQPDGTLVNALLHHCGESLSGIGGVRRPGIVHRLDKDTSGVLVVAKNDRAHGGLSQQFADHGRTGSLQRSYLALCWNDPNRESGLVDAPLGRHSQDRTKRAVVPQERSDAKDARTRWTVLRRFPEKTAGEAQAVLLRCELETGRTHQIRVHMAHIGHPLIGDAAYGAGFKTKSKRLPDAVRSVVDGFRRQALHANRLGFTHPVSGEQLVFETDPPADMAALIEAFSLL